MNPNPFTSSPHRRIRQAFTTALTASVITLAVIGLSALIPANWTGTHAFAQQTVQSKQHGYEVTVPSGWRSKKKPGDGVDLALISPKNSDDDFRSYIAIRATDNQDNSSSSPNSQARQAANTEIQRVKEVIQNVKLGDRRNFNVPNAQAAYRIVYTGEKNGKPVKLITYAVVQDNLTLTFTGTGLEKHFDQRERLFDQTVQSVSFTFSS